MLNAFHLGGWGMYPTLVFGLLLVGICITYALKPQKHLVPLLLSTGILTLVAGAAGFTSGLIATMTSATSGRFPEPPIEVAMTGLGESLHNIALALLLATLAALAVSIGALRLWLRSDRPS